MQAEQVDGAFLVDDGTGRECAILFLLVLDGDGQIGQLGDSGDHGIFRRLALLKGNVTGMTGVFTDLLLDLGVDTCGLGELAIEHEDVVLLRKGLRLILQGFHLGLSFFVRHN